MSVQSSYQCFLQTHGGSPDMKVGRHAYGCLNILEVLSVLVNSTVLHRPHCLQSPGCKNRAELHEPESFGNFTVIIS